MLQVHVGCRLVACMPSRAELCTGSTVSQDNNEGCNGKKKITLFTYSAAGWRGTGGAAALGGTGGRRRGSGTEGVLRPQAGGRSAGGAGHN